MAQLKDKQNIEELFLQWKNFKEEEEMAVDNSAMVLEGLQPHPSLEKLYINSFPGLKLPKWMGSSSCLPNLVELMFDDCKRCEKLISLGQLPCLQILEIENMNSIKCLGKALYYTQDDEEESKGSIITTAARTSFPSLAWLVIRNLESLEEWFAPEKSFTCLKQVEIEECGNLTCIPDLRLWTSSLGQLTIKGCGKLKKEPMEYYLDKFLPSVRYYR